MDDTRRIALVTGGARRIGAAIVRALHNDGMDVVIHCNRSRDDADALAADLNARRDGSATVMPADLGDDGALHDLAKRVVAFGGNLDLLVNNASTFYPTPVGSVDAAQWDDLVGTNMRAPFFLSQALAPTLRTRHGSIVNIIDIHAQRPMKDHAVYCAAKAGLGMLTRALARELGPEIRVNGVAPGAILWPEADMNESLQAKILDATALKRAGKPEDIAEAVCYLARASYITGQIIAVDGGRSIGWP